VRLKEVHQYIRMRATLVVTLLLAWEVRINFSSFGEPASRFTVQRTFGKMEEGKIATAAQFGATERVHQCI
jgi:hypothetical protein